MIVYHGSFIEGQTGFNTVELYFDGLIDKYLSFRGSEKL